jgi:hypothetical protein
MAKQSGEKPNAILVLNAVRLPATQKSLSGSNLRTEAKGACDDPLRAYTDHDIDFDINGDNATTSGSALICISGYLVG